MRKITRRHQSDLVATSWSHHKEITPKSHRSSAPDRRYALLNAHVIQRSNTTPGLYIYLLPGAFYAHKCRELFVIAKSEGGVQMWSVTLWSRRTYLSINNHSQGTRLKLLGQVPLVLTIYSLALGYIPVLYKHLHRESYLFEGDVWHVRRISNGSWSPSMGMDEAEWETWTLCESKYWRMKV